MGESGEMGQADLTHELQETDQNTNIFENNGHLDARISESNVGSSNSLHQFSVRLWRGFCLVQAVCEVWHVVAALVVGPFVSVGIDNASSSSG